MLDFMNDMSPFQVFLKPPQIGASETEIIKSFFIAKKLKRDIIYTLPTGADVSDMAGGKVNRIIAQNPILGRWVKDHDTVDQKKVGDNIIYYRGTFTAKAAMMVSSGLNIHDEVDASNPDVITQYETRLQAQEDGGWRWYFSHPSLAGHGVDIYWEQSDKKEWHINCPHCKEEQVLTWPDNIDIEKEIYICSSCKKELPDESRINGNWKSTNGITRDKYEKVCGQFANIDQLPFSDKQKIVDFSGYHASQLMLWNKSAASIIKAFNDPQKDKQYFYNYVLGLPYLGSEDRLDSTVVLRNCVDEVNTQEDRTIIGMDTGHGIHYVLMNKQGIFFYDYETEITASKNPYDKIEKLLKRFPRSIVVSDQGGDLIGVRQLQAKYPGRVFLCFYNKDRKTVDLVDWGKDQEYGKVRVDRNRMMTLLVEQMRDTGRVRINGTKDEWAEFASHFGSLYREKMVAREMPGRDNRELYGAEYVWKHNGPDHYCFIAGTKIATEHGDKPIEEVRVGDRVLTRKGFKKVYHAGKTKNDRVLTAYFSNGSSFTATADHPLIHINGKVRLDSTTRHAILYTCKNNKVLFTEGLLTDVTRNLNEEVNEFTLYPTGLLGQRGLKGFTSKYGLMPMGRFLKDVSFITQMVMRSIMSLETWCVSKEESIKANMQLKIIKMPSSGITTSSILNQYNLYHMLGGRQMKVKNGIVNTLSVLSQLNRKSLSALSVMVKVLHEAIKAVSSVAPDVVIVGSHENIGKRDVINIAVEEEAEYFANSILVSNCHATLYALVGMQRYGGEPAKIVGEDILGIPKAPFNNIVRDVDVVGQYGAEAFNQQSTI